MKAKTALVLVGVTMAAAVLPVAAITFDPFGSNGEGGSRNGQMFTIGTGATVYELDCFVHIDGQDLNGTNIGTSAKLSRDGAPTNVTFSFNAALSADGTDLTLTYTLMNAGSNTLQNVRVLAFLDGEIDQKTNTFFNEYGEQAGVLGVGESDQVPDLWQIDEPGFVEGTLVDQLLLGILGNTNAVPVNSPDDVSLGLGFRLGNIPVGQALDVSVQISEDGDAFEGVSLAHRDIDPDSTTVITFSGRSAQAVHTLTNLVVTGDQVVIEETSGTYMSTAWFFDSAAGDVSTNVTAASSWSFVGSVPPGTVLNGNVMTAGTVAADTVVTVRAEYTYGLTTRSDTLDVTIRNRRTLTNLVASGSATIPENTSDSYTAMAYFWDLLLTNVSENVSTAATWSIVGTVPPGTIVNGGLLTAGDVDMNTPIQLRAEYTYENVTKADTVDVLIVAGRGLTNLVVTGNTVILEESSDSYLGTAYFYDGQLGSFSSNVTDVSTWSLVGFVPPGTSLSSNRLMAGSVTTDTVVTVRAEYTYERSTKSDTLDVTIRNRRVLTNLIASGSATIPENTSDGYTAMAHFWDILLTNVSENVSAAATWSIVGAVPTGTSLNGNLLTAGEVSVNTPIQLRAEYTYENVTKADTVDVTIIADRELTNLVVAGAAEVLEESNSGYTATAYFYDGLLGGSFNSNVTAVANWSLQGSVPVGTVQNGSMLNAGTVTNDAPVTVRAEYSYNQVTKFDTQPVLIRNRRALTNLVVSGDATILEGATGVYTSVAHFWDIALTSVSSNVSAVAAWSIVGPAPVGTALVGDTLVAGNVGTNTPIQIRASYSYEGRTETDTVTVTIVAQGLQEVPLDLTFTWTLSRQTGTYFGTIEMANPAQTGFAMTRDFLFAIHPHAEFRFMSPDGVMADGDSYTDITAKVLAALQQTGNKDNVFDVGETIEIKDIEVYSRRRLVPPDTLFEVWAQRQ